MRSYGRTAATVYPPAAPSAARSPAREGGEQHTQMMRGGARARIAARASADSPFRGGFTTSTSTPPEDRGRAAGQANRGVGGTKAGQRAEAGRTMPSGGASSIASALTSTPSTRAPRAASVRAIPPTPVYRSTTRTPARAPASRATSR